MKLIETCKNVITFWGVGWGEGAVQERAPGAENHSYDPEDSLYIIEWNTKNLDLHIKLEW
jgi:hypothetical protein